MPQTDGVASEDQETLCLASGSRGDQADVLPLTGLRIRPVLFPLYRTFELEGQPATPGAASIVINAVVPSSFKETSRKLRSLARVKIPAAMLPQWSPKPGEQAQRFERKAV